MTIYPVIDVPFEHRHQCWFCAEPSNRWLDYQAQAYTPHPSLAVPCCNECLQLAKKHPSTSIWDCQLAVKDALMTIYQKDLAIGINWTEEELQQTEFADDCKIFGGFKKSAWFMYQVAKQRINTRGWSIVIAGIPFDDNGFLNGFEFDDVHYRSVQQAILHYSKTWSLDANFVEQIVNIVGRNQFSYALRIARINLSVSKERKLQVLQQLQQPD
ncbi:hypothetical protein [Shewanella marina]|uniref:hypothetical protein n=1 Tax=Shewanella marina TaxID=487319 RepID=UPI000471F90E|nr:hypothetical protein [Shewanella marina]